MTDVTAILAALRPPVVISGRCAKCGDPIRDPAVRDFDVSVSPRGGLVPARSIGVCESCLATAHDRDGSLAKAVKPGDGQQRDGWVDPAATDPQDKTGEAVRGRKPGKHDRPPTRKERRAAEREYARQRAGAG